MRIIVFFDLPVKTMAERRHYTRFRKYLLSQGFDMLQFSVYARVCNGMDNVDKYVNNVTMHLPPKGSIRLLTITDKQYGRMKMLLGKPTKFEKKVSGEQLVLL